MTYKCGKSKPAKSTVIVSISSSSFQNGAEVNKVLEMTEMWKDESGNKRFCEATFFLNQFCPQPALPAAFMAPLNLRFRVNKIG